MMDDGWKEEERGKPKKKKKGENKHTQDEMGCFLIKRLWNYISLHFLFTFPRR